MSKQLNKRILTLSEMQEMSHYKVHVIQTGVHRVSKYPSCAIGLVLTQRGYRRKANFN